MSIEVSSTSPNKHENHEPPGLESRAGSGSKGRGLEVTSCPAPCDSLLRGSGLAGVLTRSDRCARLRAAEADLPASGKPTPPEKLRGRHGKAWEELGAGDWRRYRAPKLIPCLIDLLTWTWRDLKLGKLSRKEPVSNTSQMHYYCFI